MVKATTCKETARARIPAVLMALFTGLGVLMAVPNAVRADDDYGSRTPTISLARADWVSDRNVLRLKIKAEKGQAVSIYNAYAPHQLLAQETSLDEDEWKPRLRQPDPVPCRVRARNDSTGDVVEREVRDRSTGRQPVNCAPSEGGGTPTNQEPTADAGPDQTLQLAAGETSIAVTLDGSGSTDSDGSIAACTWTGTPDPADTMSPTVPLGAGTHSFTLVVTDDDGASSGPDRVQVTVNAAPNQTPTAAAGPDQTLELAAGQTTLVVTLDGSGSADSDGSIAAYAWTGTPDPADTARPILTLGAGSYHFTLVVTDDDGESSAPDAVQVIVTEPVAAACDPVPSDPQVAHAECMPPYTGPQVCVACHEDAARDVHGSAHYQQGGAFPNVTNVPEEFQAAGERPAQGRQQGNPAGNLIATGINTYCGTHENSPRFTCASCHVGNGRFPMAQTQFEQLNPDSAEAHRQLANIDCLTCHQELYKRFPDPTAGFEDLVLENVIELSDGSLAEAPGNSVIRTGLAGIPIVDPETLDFDFVPADPSNPALADIPAGLMAITAQEAAEGVHQPTRRACLNCHAGAAGADGAKRGDLNSHLADPPLALDMHMSAAGGDLTCSDCHAAVGANGEGHRFRGRGLDLRPNDVEERFTCENSGCHSDRPHGDFSTTSASSRDKHAMKIACQTCHISTFAKVVNGVGVPTEVSRDWQDPHLSQSACNSRGGWLPREDKASNLTPTYAWFDGTSEIYYLGEPLHDPDVPTKPLDATVASLFGPGFDAGDPAYVLGMPNGDVASATAKLYPMKEHWGKLARHLGTDTLIGHSTFDFFRTGDFDLAVRGGMAQTPGMDEGDDFEVVAVHTYQTINHGVETANNALDCGACHGDLSGGPLRVDLQKDLGYGLRVGQSAVTDTRTQTLDGTFNTICTQCHGNETSKRGFSEVHHLHVREKRRDCAACHNFSRPERGLSLTRK
jgi:hypothetical protein